MSRQFNGTSDHMTNATAISSFIANNAATIACWIKPTGTAANDATVYHLQPILSDSANGYIQATTGRVSSGTDSFHAYNYHSGTADAAAAITRNAWQHVAFTNDGTTLRTYLDGVASGTASTGTTDNLAGTLDVGAYAATYFYLGFMAYLHTFNRALSASEIVTLRTTPNSPPANNTGYWKFQTSGAGPETDQSSGGHNLTYSGTTYSTDDPVLTTSLPPHSPPVRQAVTRASTY